MRLSVSVPANLLLAGEYAVLEPGGLGLAFGVEKRITVEARDDTELRIEGKFGKGSGGLDDSQVPSREPTPHGRTPQGLIDTVVHTCARWLSARGSRAELAAFVSIGSSACYDDDGRKRGFGSSAAVCVGLCYTILKIAGIPSEALALQTVPIALESHRKLPGGVGSGYDVYASFHGGTGLFVGGERPEWSPIDIGWLPQVYLFSGTQSVHTPDAVNRYTEWKRAGPVAAADYLLRSKGTATNP